MTSLLTFARGLPTFGIRCHGHGQMVTRCYASRAKFRPRKFAKVSDFSHDSFSWLSKKHDFYSQPFQMYDNDGNEVSTKIDHFEANQQAFEVARKANEKVRGRRVSAKGQPHTFVQPLQPVSIPTSSSLQEDYLDIEPTKDVDDPLPSGVSFKDLPRFQKIHAWEKGSKEMKNLKKELSHLDKKDDTVVLETKRLIKDAIEAGLYPSTLVFSRLNLLEGIPFDLDKKLAMYQIPYRNISAWSELSVHPGVMGTLNTLTRGQKN